LSQLLYSKREDLFGPAATKFRWRPSGNVLAASGSNNVLAIFDRKGEPIDTHHTTSGVVDFAWDHEGDIIAMLIEKSPILTLFDVATHNLEMIDVSTGPKEFPLCVAWSPVKQVLCVGNSNGNIMIYDHQTQKKNPILGKHQRKITHVFISPDDTIICASEDSSITLSNFEGETLHQFQCTATPTQVQTFEMRVVRPDEPDKKSKQIEVHLSAILGNKHLMLVNLAKDQGNGGDTPTVNLAFQDQYGDIVTYSWYDNGRLIVGFRSGQWVSISARESEIGSELHTEKAFTTYLSDITVNQAMGRIVCCGDNQIRIYDLSSYQILEIVGVLESEKELAQCEISPDQRMCAVASMGGFIGVYLVSVTQLGTAYKDTVAVLSALDEITVMQEADKRHAVTVPTVVEPSVIAVGPRHVGVGVNNTVWFYDYANRTSQPVAHYEYLSTVLGVYVNLSHAAVVMDGRLRLQTILEDDHHGEDGIVRSANFPEQERGGRLVDAALTDDFLVFATDTNYIVYFALTEWQVVSEYRHSQAVRKIVVEPDGVRLILFDAKMDTYVYSPVDDSLLKLPAIGATIQYKGALWETFTIDRDTFIVFDANEIYVFLLSRDEIGGEGIVYVGKTKLDYGHTPLMLSKGIVCCLTASGRTSGILLQSNMTDNVFDKRKPEEFVQMLKQAISLKRWSYAFRLCEYTRQEEMWRDLGKALLRNNQISMARRVFGLIDDVGTVWSLEDIEAMEERSLRAGHLAVLLGDIDAAEGLFLHSTQPVEALNMRRDLLHWPRALALAQTLKPDEIPHISKEYAQQLEYNGQYAEALRHYEEGEFRGAEREETDEMLEHNEICRSGIARMSIRTGDLRRGIDLAHKLDGRVVKRDCAIILEELRQYSDAAVLFEQGRYYDRAAAVCLKSKNWVKVADLLPHVRSPKIHSQYGKVMEADQKYKQAAIAYKNARDYDNLVRILLNHLNMPEEAVAIVRESRSAEGAKLVANFFLKLGDHSSAIKFLVMSQCHAEAFYLAEQNVKMDEYAEALGTSGTTEQYAQIADYYLSQGNTVEAGRFYLYASNHQLALNLLLTPENGENATAVRLAIDTCVASRDPTLRKHLQTFLMGEEDGRPKDPRFIFKMFVAFGQTREAARTAVLIARDEQERGSSRTAHKMLLQMYRELHLKGMRVPTEMEDLLMFIHSYLITKRLIQRNEMKAAARMLLRTAANISLFPKHSTTILTSTVVICVKAELPHTALKYAKMLMTPDHRPKIDQRYAKKIEQLVRKGAPSGTTAQSETEQSTPCPFCNKQVVGTVLNCEYCKSKLPYCILTGRHVVADDFAVCPSCDFPAIKSEMIREMKSSTYTCPMCEEPVEMEQIIPIEFKSYMARDETRETITI
ncbi:hypothetical protein PFISCL1PPCAC_11964, partial [Pristionchus fissidentatus]